MKSHLSLHPNWNQTVAGSFSTATCLKHNGCHDHVHGRVWSFWQVCCLICAVLYVQAAIEIPIEFPIQIPMEAPIEIPIQLSIEIPTQIPIESPIEIPSGFPIEIPNEIQI